jgi:transcriptional regulator with XRE-family HTH domain
MNTEQKKSRRHEEWFPPGAEPAEIGKRIRQLRESHGLTLEGFAELLVGLGASPTTQKSTVSKWERGEVENIANTTVYFIVKALHTTHEYLLFGPKGEPKSPVVALRRRKV